MTKYVKRKKEGKFGEKNVKRERIKNKINKKGKR